MHFQKLVQVFWLNLAQHCGLLIWTP